jgi:ketosteroid isomerase-like protein
MLALAGCATTPHSSDAKSEILRVDAEWQRAVGDGDVDRIVSYWADDATVMPPGGPSITGKDALRRFIVESLHTPDFKITWTTDAVVVSAGGDMAYATGTNHVTLTDEDGESVDIVGKTVTVWRKLAGKGWKCTLDIWNDVPPPDEDESASM